MEIEQHTSAVLQALHKKSPAPRSLDLMLSGLYVSSFTIGQQLLWCVDAMHIIRPSEYCNTTRTSHWTDAFDNTGTPRFLWRCYFLDYTLYQSEHYKFKQVISKIHRNSARSECVHLSGLGTARDCGELGFFEHNSTFHTRRQSGQDGKLPKESV